MANSGMGTCVFEHMNGMLHVSECEHWWFGFGIETEGTGGAADLSLCRMHTPPHFRLPFPLEASCLK